MKYIAAKHNIEKAKKTADLYTFFENKINNEFDMSKIETK